MHKAVERAAKAAEVDEDEDGPSLTDVDGLRLSLRVSRRHKIDAESPPMNTMAAARIDRRAPVYDRARPLKIGHVVLFSPAVTDAVRFYEEALGFVLSDCYPEAGYFLRLRP